MAVEDLPLATNEDVQSPGLGAVDGPGNGGIQDRDVFYPCGVRDPVG